MKKNAFRMGLSMEEFWFDNPQNYFLRLDVYNEESKKHVDELDYLAWRTAYYTMLGTQQSLAVKRCSIFPKEPYMLKERQKEENDKKYSDLASNDLERRLFVVFFCFFFVFDLRNKESNNG